jgi:hypothetical protein
VGGGCEPPESPVLLTSSRTLCLCEGVQWTKVANWTCKGFRVGDRSRGRFAPTAGFPSTRL